MRLAKYASTTWGGATRGAMAMSGCLKSAYSAEDMNHIAESGIAAHWKYKQDEHEGSAQQERARKWLSNLVEMEVGGNSEEFIESVKVDLFPDKVYVFTPRGEIRSDARRVGHE